MTDYPNSCWPVSFNQLIKKLIISELAEMQQFHRVSLYSLTEFKNNMRPHIKRGRITKKCLRHIFSSFLLWLGLSVKWILFTIISYFWGGITCFSHWLLIPFNLEKSLICPKGILRYCYWPSPKQHSVSKLCKVQIFSAKIGKSTLPHAC